MQRRLMTTCLVVALGLGPSRAVAETCPTERGFSDTTSRLFLLFPTETTHLEPWPMFPSFPQDVAPFEISLFAPDLTGTTEAELIADIHAKVIEDYCEFDVEVLTSRKLSEIPSYARRNIVGIGSDADRGELPAPNRGKFCWAFGRAQEVDNGDKTAVDTARVYAGSFRKRYGVDSEPLDCDLTYEPPRVEDPDAFEGAKSTRERWANAIAGTAAHEAGHNYGAEHDSPATRRPGEDPHSNHLMADSKTGLNEETRATRNRHFSDISYSLIARNVGLSAATLHNWDFVNPNATTAKGLRVKVNALTGSLTRLWSYSGPSSPWEPPTIEGPSGEETFRGTTYKIYFLKWNMPVTWDGGPPGEVGAGSSFHIGLSFIETGPVIVREAVLVDGAGADLGLRPRMLGYDDGAMKIKTGSFVVDLFNTTSDLGPLVLSNVVIRLMPRMVDLETMTPEAQLPLSREGLPVVPWRTVRLPSPIVLDSDQPVELPIADLAAPRFVDLTNPGCGVFDDGGENDVCLSGRALGLFPSTYVYITAKVTDPDALHWDNGTGSLVRGPVDSFLFYQVKGFVPDCNGNGRDDLLDVDDGSSRDANGNGAPDECEGLEVNLGVAKTASSSTIVAGQTIGYIVTVSNPGPDAAHGATLADAFSPALIGPTWSCGSAAGSGDLHATFVLAPGDSAVCTVTATVNPTYFGPLQNTATVSAPPDATEPDRSDNSATVETLVFPPSGVVATKEVSGAFVPEGLVSYRLLILNGGPAAQADNPGDEFVDSLPAELLLLGASASSGSVSANLPLGQVTWNGAIAPGGVVEIAIQARVVHGVSFDTVVSNQGTVSFDTDGDGTNDASTTTDDPGQPGANDPTTFRVKNIAAIPTLSTWGILSLIVVLMLLGASWLARWGNGS